jgi:hypothetical protein
VELVAGHIPILTCAIAGVAVFLAGCSSGDGTQAGPRAAVSAVAGPAPVTGPCDMPVLDRESSFQADARNGSIAALVFGELPAQVGTQLKVVWRVTGSGALTVTSERPDGTAAALAFGPEAHEGSTFHRPGDEWGTGFLFDAAGCWHIDVSRGQVSARVPIEVRPGAGNP